MSSISISSVRVYLDSHFYVILEHVPDDHGHCAPCATVLTAPALTSDCIMIEWDARTRRNSRAAPPPRAALPTTLQVTPVDTLWSENVDFNYNARKTKRCVQSRVGAVLLRFKPVSLSSNWISCQSESDYHCNSRQQMLHKSYLRTS